jgi:hypothetical protein
MNKKPFSKIKSFKYGNVKKNKTSKNMRKSPIESATLFPEGTIRRGNDGQKWVNKKTGKDTLRWMPYVSIELNGFKALTVDYLSKNIGKEIEIYERGYMEGWPTQGDSDLLKLRWVANGHAKYFKNKTLIENWLKLQKPDIKDRTVFSLMGKGDWYNDKEMSEMSLQVDSNNKKLVSSNIMNMESFVKI